MRLRWNCPNLDFPGDYDTNLNFTGVTEMKIKIDLDIQDCHDCPFAHQLTTSCCGPTWSCFVDDYAELKVGHGDGIPDNCPIKES